MIYHAYFTCLYTADKFEAVFEDAKFNDIGAARSFLSSLALRYTLDYAGGKYFSVTNNIVEMSEEDYHHE